MYHKPHNWNATVSHMKRQYTSSYREIRCNVLICLLNNLHHCISNKQRIIYLANVNFLHDTQHSLQLLVSRSLTLRPIVSIKEESPYWDKGHAVAQLRHCATGRKVASSITDGFIEVFHWQIPSLASTQPLTEMSIRNISCG